MATTRTFLQNASTRHAIFIGRFAGSQIKEVLPLLERVRDKAISKLSRVDTTTIGKRRLNALIGSLEDELDRAYTQLGKKLERNMKEFADYEADFSARMFTKATNTDFSKPSRAVIEAAIFTTPLLTSDDNLSIEGALRQFSDKKRKEMVNVIKDGVVAGHTSDEIIKQVEFTANKIQRNHTSALVRTVTNHVSTAARQITIEDNDDVVKGVEWVSTLDSKTTHTCQALDGRVFAENKGPRPPIHWGCRSTVIPKVKDEFSIIKDIDTERPAIGDDGVETVKGTTTYNSWLNKQPNSFQDEVLGPDRGKLFREGGLSVRQFVDRNYEPLTLKQLKRKEPLAFEKAGLND